MAGADVCEPSHARVTVYSKPGCHLCEEAVRVVARVCSELSVSWAEIDIAGDSALMHEFGEQIPVTFVDGRQHDFWRVDEQRLRSAIG
jgi:glutaredoxin